MTTSSTARRIILCSTNSARRTRKRLKSCLWSATPSQSPYTPPLLSTSTRVRRLRCSRIKSVRPRRRRFDWRSCAMSRSNCTRTRRSLKMIAPRPFSVAASQGSETGKLPTTGSLRMATAPAWLNAIRPSVPRMLWRRSSLIACQPRWRLTGTASLQTYSAE